MADNESECMYCGDPILWFKTEKGANIPIDPEPADLSDEAVKKIAKYQMDDEDPETVFFVPPKERVGKCFTTHFDTCTDPDQVEKREAREREYRRSQARRRR